MPRHYTNIPMEFGPPGVELHPEKSSAELMLERAMQPGHVVSVVPEGVSTGRLGCGIATTALGALQLVQAGMPVPLTYIDLYKPIA